LNEIAAELRVQFFLEGSVRRDASRVRITAQLIQAADQTHLWASTYDDEANQILNIQSKVAQAICEAIQVKISPPQQQRLARPRLVNPAAHEAYLKGLYYWNKFTPVAAAMGIRHLQQAITIDPQHGPAHAALAQVFGMMGYWGLALPAQVNPLARAEALKALEIDESLSVAHGALGCVLCLHDWKYEAGEREIQRAIELNPSEATNHLWYAIYYAAFAENMEKAIAEAQTAARLDPWAPLTGLMVSSVYLLVDEFERARDQAQGIVEMLPDSHYAYRVLGLAYLGEGLFGHAVAALEKGTAIARDPASLALLAEAYGLSGERDKARVLIKELEERNQREYVLPTAMAWAYTGLGEFDAAFHWLEVALEQHTSTLLLLRAGLMFDPLRADPRFADLLSRLHLPA
jgi:tetratricopeptide (TPR) repeat protein